MRYPQVVQNSKNKEMKMLEEVAALANTNVCYGTPRW
jgi:hypothetical protein